MIEPKAAPSVARSSLRRRGGPDRWHPSRRPRHPFARADVISSLREQLWKLVPGIDLGVADKLFVFDRARNEIAADGMLWRTASSSWPLDGQRDKGRTLGHEAIHACAPAIRGTPFGLFREREWKVPERTLATQRDGLMDAVRRTIRPVAERAARGGGRRAVRHLAHWGEATASPGRLRAHRQLPRGPGANMRGHGSPPRHR